MAGSADNWQGALGVSHPLQASDVLSTKQEVRQAGPLESFYL